MQQPAPGPRPGGEDALALPDLLEPWRRRRGYLLLSSALTFGTLRAPGNEPLLRSMPPVPAQPDPPAAEPQAPLIELRRQNPMHQSAAGPLRHGNPRGNPNAAPRCGARTRAAAPCRSPAMPNGRCRMHGGTSTGPRTLAGLNRLRAAATKHGAYATSIRRRALDPADPFARHAAATAISDVDRLLALIRASAPHDPDPAALRALLQPQPLPIRHSREPHAT